MKPRSKFLSLLLVLCLLLGTPGISARAEEPEDDASPEAPGPSETFEAPEAPESLGIPDPSEMEEALEAPPGDPPAETPEADGPEAVCAVHEGVGLLEDSIPFSRLPASIGLVPGASYTGRYYDQLDGASQAVYDAIRQSPLWDGPTTEAVPLQVPYGAAPSEPILAALGALLHDHPELSWLVGTSFYYTYRGGSLTSYRMSDEGYRNATTDPGPEITPDTRAMADTGDRAAIEAALRDARAELGGLAGLSEYGRVKAIHDWVCRHMEYTDQSGSKFQYGWRGFQTPYSALVERDTVCAGYAKAFKLLCDEYGVPCAIVVGLGNSGLHAWNYVELGGAWYAVDCTWGDLGSRISYQYFLKGSEQFLKHEEGTLYGEYAFAYPSLSREDYTDPTAPASMELSYSPEADAVSSQGHPGFRLPAVDAPGVQVSREILLTAVPRDAGGAELTDGAVEWSMNRELDGVTLTPDGSAAVLTFSNSSLRGYSGNGPLLTVTASCGTTTAEQELWLYVPRRTPSFLSILRGGLPVSSGQLAPGGSASYTAAVYDQYGMELPGQPVAWQTEGGAQILELPNGAVILTAAEEDGAAVLTARADSLSAALSISITEDGHRHLWAEDWSRDQDAHWHECAGSGCGLFENSGKDGYAAHSYDVEYCRDAGSHWHECVCGAQTVPVPHSWDEGTILREPDFDAAGVRLYACSACGQTRDEEIPRLEHAYSDLWSSSEAGHWHACTDPGYEDLQRGWEAHTWGGSLSAVCDTCGYARVLIAAGDGAYQAVNAPAGARMFLARYGEDRRLASARELDALSGALSGSGRLFLLDGSLRPLCPPGALAG